ncbi:MAG: peptidyl-prolyl cis-trans isomerase SurA [Gammaproteobacteria bacterium]|jgi:peptidyl-prolyl cis-trans isomerase SurA|nr:peptidyl-prolyl cis-trans isomerase SurA [Gammaproteobacteria bacterium]
MRKYALSWFGAAAAILLPVMSHAQTRDIGVHGEMLDRIAAIVNDGLVLKSELDSQMDSVTKRLQEQKVELPSQSVLKQQVLDRLILQEIQAQHAKRVGLTVSDEQLNGALQEIATRNKIPFDQLPTALGAQGVDYKQYREGMRRELTLNTLRQRDVIAHINVSPRELEQFLARQQSAASNDEFNVSHILLSLPEAATPQQLDDITHKAQDLAARASKGEDFGQLAIANSNSQTALDGGQLGWRKGTQLPQFILDLVTKMKTGEVSAPVRTPSGFHIVKLNERRSGEAPVIINQIHVRHVLMKTNELDDDETVRQKLSKLRDRILKGEDFAGLASTNSADPGSAPDGGDLGWSGPGTFVPEFDKAIADLKVNEISEPFKSRYGWHIAQMLGTRTYDSTDDVRRQRAFAAIRESKADEETELWLRRLRDEAFVEVKL